MGDILKNPAVTKRTFTNRQTKWYQGRKDPAKSPNQQSELQLLKQVCHYLKLQYPRVVFRSDSSSGRWEYSKQRLHEKVALNSSKSFPDLFIYEPRMVKGTFYCGLAIELKTEGTTVILKTGPRKGHLTTNPHIQEQAVMLKHLNKLGYYANFAVGLDDAMAKIDWYFGKPSNSTMF